MNQKNVFSSWELVLLTYPVIKEGNFLPIPEFEPTIYLPNYLISPDATDYVTDDLINPCI